MCDSTRAYLRQLATSAQHEAAINHVTQQLATTQIALSDTKEDLKLTRAQLVEARRLLQAVVMNRNESPSDSQQEQAAHDTELIIEFLVQSKPATGSIELNGDAAAGAIADVGTSALLGAVEIARLSPTPPSLFLKSSGNGKEGDSNAAGTKPVSSSSSSTGSGDTFDWKKLGRGALMDRIKSSQQQQNK